MLNNDNDNFLFFVLGGLIGAIIGIMYAPERGYRTRRKVKNFIDNVRDCSAERLEKVRTKINDLCENGNEMIIKDEKDNIEESE